MGGLGIGRGIGMGYINDNEVFVYLSHVGCQFTKCKRWIMQIMFASWGWNLGQYLSPVATCNNNYDMACFQVPNFWNTTVEVIIKDFYDVSIMSGIECRVCKQDELSIAAKILICWTKYVKYAKWIGLNAQSKLKPWPNSGQWNSRNVIHLGWRSMTTAYKFEDKTQSSLNECSVSHKLNWDHQGVHPLPKY